MVALCLGGCSGQGARHAPEPTPVVAETAPPVVLFRLLIIRDWDCPWFVVESEDHDFTLQEAIAFGIPAELWISLAVNGDGKTRFEIYWCRPLRC